MTRKRQLDGIALAKERGVYKGKPSLTPDEVKVIRERLIVSLEPW
jgi:DNA invertase Pin-like site-specific DNA recombinase